MYNLLEYLERSAARVPDKRAFEDIAKSVTFRQLLDRAQSIGSGLLLRGAAHRSAVAVCLEKGADAVTAFMGALYASCFYCYIDPKQPIARSRAMLSALGPCLIVTDEKGLGLFQDMPCPAFLFSELESGCIDEAALADIRRNHIDTDAAYCSFTSGSTGSPKGVLVSHRSVIDFIDVFIPLFGITEADVLACQSPFDFDVSVKDIFSGLKTGATVVLVPKYYFVFLPNLLELLTEKKVTTLIWAVSALCLLSERNALEFAAPPCINKVLFSGEVMPPSHLLYWKRFYPDALYVNLYGPTEITCNCTYYILPPDYAGGEISIGGPFPNERVFLLGDGDTLVTAPGEQGELCVAGAALALGYCGAPEQTGAAFVQNPLCPLWRETIYRSGDLARYGPDGLLYYAGRRDHQIKRHGRRVEPGEIESALHRLDGVSRACVLYFPEQSKLVAFLSGGPFEKLKLTKSLQGLLPDYMIPDDYVFPGSLPLTDHGKLDRAALRGLYLPEAPAEASDGK